MGGSCCLPAGQGRQPAHLPGAPAMGRRSLPPSLHPFFLPSFRPPAPAATGRAGGTDLRAAALSFSPGEARPLLPPQRRGREEAAGLRRAAAGGRAAVRGGGRCRPAPRLAPVGGAAARAGPGAGAAPAHLHPAPAVAGGGAGAAEEGPAPGPGGVGGKVGVPPRRESRRVGRREAQWRVRRHRGGNNAVPGLRG